MSDYIRLEIVEKYNPYHDSKGRFTTAGGATSFSIASRSGLEWDKKNVERAIEREKQRTAGAGDGAARIKTAEDDLKTVLKEGAVVNFAGMDADLAQETTDTIKRVIEKYPSCKDAFAGFTTDDTDKGTFTEKDSAMACFSEGTKMIHLNNAYYGNKAEFDAKVKESIEKQFHPKGTDYNSVVVHEMGHAIDSYVSEKIFDIWDLVGGKRVSTEIWNADIDKAKKKGEPMTGKTIRENLSGYASRKPAEYLAEGFSEVMCSSNPRPTAKSIVKRLDNRVAKMEKKAEESKGFRGLI